MYLMETSTNNIVTKKYKIIAIRTVSVVIMTNPILSTIDTQTISIVKMRYPEITQWFIPTLHLHFKNDIAGGNNIIKLTKLIIKKIHPRMFI